jgi:DNA-binding transcriptional MerR regulator
MKQWYVKDLSEMTGVSVQTLHYYDRIGLLTPSVRQGNGYRVYSETDLLTLQRIIALKFFGFELQQMNMTDDNILQSFIDQKRELQKKSVQIQNTIHTLDKVINEFEMQQTIDWKNVLILLENYQMLSENNYQILLSYEKSLENVLTPKELDQYFHLKGSKFANTDEYKAYTQEWIILAQEAMSHINKDPASVTGKILAKKWIDLINCMYPNEYRALQITIWEKGYKTGKIKNEIFPPALVEWISKVLENYHEQSAS